MPEIVQTKDRKGRTRYGWRCEDCRATAGAWPAKHTADNSADRHARYCKVKKNAA